MVKTNKKKIDEFKDLSEKSKIKYAQQLKRLEKHGLTITQAKKLSNQELAEKLEYKGSIDKLDSNMEGIKKNLKAMTLIPNRRKDTMEYTIIKKESIEKGTSEYTLRYKMLIKFMGQKYWDIVDRLTELQKENPNKINFKDYYYEKEVKNKDGSISVKKIKSNEIFDYARNFMAVGSSITDIIDKTGVRNAKELSELEFLIPSIYDDKIELEQWEFDLANEYRTP